MPAPDQERLEAIEARIARIEVALGLTAPATPENPRPEPEAADEPVIKAELPPPLPPPSLPPTPAPLSFGGQSPLLPSSPLETRFGLNWLNRIGVITLVLGVGFFFKLASDNGWIGPGVRVALGIVAATLALALGEWASMRSQKTFAQGLTGLGLALLYLSFYATFGFYHLLPQPVAFALMAITTVCAGLLALHYASQAVAVLGLLGGYLTPPLLSTGEDHPWTLFTYTFLLNAGALAIGRSRRWKPLERLALIATIVLFAVWAGSYLGDETRIVATVFAIAFYAQFTIGSDSRATWSAAQLIAGISAFAIWPDAPHALGLACFFAAAGIAVAGWRLWAEAPLVTTVVFWLSDWAASGKFQIDENRMVLFAGISAGFALFFLWTAWWTLARERTARVAELLLLSFNPIVYFSTAYYLLDPPYHAYMGAFAVVLAALHGIFARFVWKTGSGVDSWAGRLAAAVAAVLMTVAIPIQFAGYRVTIAWALEGAALSWIGARFGWKLRVGTDDVEIGGWPVFVLVFLRLFVADAWIHENGFFNARLLTFAISAGCLWAAARFHRARESAGAAYIAGHVVMLFALGLETSEWAQRNARPEDFANTSATALMIVLSLYASALVTAGVFTRTAINRILGLALFGFVVVKLYLVDVWQLSRGFRITAFLALGCLLLLVSYLYSRFRTVIERIWRDRPAEP